MWDRTALVFVMTLLAGCASTPGGRGRERVRITPAELLAGRPLGFTQDQPALANETDLLAVSAGMRSFLDRIVAPGADRVSRLRQLGDAIIRGGEFRLEYDETTRTAAETFEARRGNCLSFSSLFVAMAREAGLKAHFQEVDTPPDWSFRDEAFVLNRHVNVTLDLGRQGEHVVDFNMDDFRTSYDRRIISDARALAHYHNNVAVERMQAGDTASALRHFRKAVDNDPSFPPTWTNLGVLYLRSGHLAYAEAAQLQALKADPADLVAMSNLAGLYERQGARERAASYRRRVLHHRDRNPYYRFQLAREAFRAEDYDAAIGYLNDAVRAKKNEDQFYSLLAMSYLKKGDTVAARRFLSRAEEVASTDVLKRRYASKMDILLPPPRDDRRPE